ncbi:MAG: GNAT family N-acetyltransferase [Nocardioides sp.]
MSLAVGRVTGQAQRRGYDVRPAAAADLPLLAEIEGAADQLFTSVFGDLDWDPPTDGEARAAEPGYLLVAGEPAVGFAHVVFLDEAAHLQQLAVHPAAMGQGIGTALLEAACESARESGRDALSLSTFADVPWNAPFYAARGFSQVTDPAPYQRRLREHEQALGLDRHGPRVVMSRSLGALAPAP